MPEIHAPERTVFQVFGIILVLGMGALLRMSGALVCNVTMTVVLVIGTVLTGTRLDQAPPSPKKTFQCVSCCSFYQVGPSASKGQRGRVCHRSDRATRRYVDGGVESFHTS